MYQELKCRIRGLQPMLQHNGQLADPMNKWAKAIKAESSKRKKTDETHEELSRLEFMGSLYLDQKNEPCVPGENIEAMLLSAAKKRKEGTLCKTGIMVTGDFPLQYSGPRNPDALWEAQKFTFRIAARVNAAKVMRTRPIFRAWALDFTIHVDPDIVDQSIVEEWLDIAASQVGLSDWRPRFGRFEVIRE